MRKLHTALLAVAGVALAAGAAEAAERMKTMQVAMPDGSIAEIHYAGDVAPRVEVVPIEAQRVIAYDPFAELDRISAMMEARHAAMMRQMAAIQQRIQAAAAAGASAPGQVVVTGALPAGAHYSYTMVSTSSGANGCTQTVEYSSDGSSAEPKVTRTSSGDCSAVEKNAAPVQVSAPAKPAEPAVPVVAPRVVGQTGLPSNKT
jgi:hypothetical protein